MTDSAAPRQTKGWPLIAISLLILLLAGFLVVKLRKRDDLPLIVKEPPPSVQSVDPLKPTAPVKPGTPEPVAKPGDAEFGEHLKTLKKALEEKRWDDAAAAFEVARKLRPGAVELRGTEEAIAEGRKKEEAERAEIARKAELRRRQEREWAVRKEEIEKLQTQDQWDAALGLFDKMEKEFPEIVRDTGYAATKNRVTGYQAEADKEFRKGMAGAKEHFDAGRYPQAFSLAEGALKFYPERKAEVRAFQDKVQEAQSEKTMVRIPSAASWIGSESREAEKPLRQVKLPAFLIDKFEVTNEDYAAFVASTGRMHPVYWPPDRKPPKGLERHPVVFVSWEDASAYATWAGKRLPTAEEWEVAARGIDQREFPWGNTFMEKEDKFPCNCLEFWQVNKSSSPGTTPVDDKRFDNGQSVFGVFGMGGNVWEWTATAAPAKGSKPPPEFRVLKGGSFMTPQKATRCANVYAEDPRLPHPDVGFRCVRDVK
jgi:formylglycine-generating enzyme required for sulfatase activity